MTASSSHHGAGSVLRWVLVLLAVLVSTLCAAGQSAAEPVAAEPASAAADARPAVGPFAGKAAERAGTDVHQADDLSSPDAGHCGKQTASDTAVARDGFRPSAPLPAPESDEHRTPAAPGPGSASAGPCFAPLAPGPVQLSVLRI